MLTGGSDKPYALGLASALARQGVAIEFVGSDEPTHKQVQPSAHCSNRPLEGTIHQHIAITVDNPT
jgi:hypothetical protein